MMTSLTGAEFNSMAALLGAHLSNFYQTTARFAVAP